MGGRGGFGLFLFLVSLTAGVSVTIGACDGRVPLDPGGGSAGSTPSGSGAGTGGTAPPSSNSGESGPAGGVGGATGTAVVDDHGTGGANGSGGTTPPADAGPATGPRSCTQLEADYVAAVEAAKACDPASSVPQCTLVIIPALCVGGCSTMVNDTALPYAVRRAWDAVPCPVTQSRCGPASSSCPSTHVARCLPNSDGTGRCVDVTP